MKGIGRQIALELSKAGYDIVLNYRTESPALSELVSEIESGGVKAYPFACDVSDFEKSKEMMEYALSLNGSIDVLVNNAGITRDKLLARMSEEEFDLVLDSNLKGAFNCIRHSMRAFMKQKKGSIINITSVVGRTGNIGQANYAASKAGMIGLTQTAARELAPYGVRVNAVAPGFIRTSMTDVLSDEIKEKILSSIPMRTMGEAKDIANMVKFLASDESGYITGQVINVDGGMLMD